MNAQSYLLKHSYSSKLIDVSPDPRLKACVIIPSCNEAHLDLTIDSLCSAHPIDGSCELIVVLNHPDNAADDIKSFHQKQYDKLLTISNQWCSTFLKIHVLPVQQLPSKIAGVGLARKIGMDEAIRRFDQIHSKGLIYNIDADCSCHPDYFVRSSAYMDSCPDKAAAVLGFVHPDEKDPLINRAIMEYELHLRVYINWQRQLDYPFAFQTLGSCFVVRSEDYMAQGGMNKRKAGEDFYFLHKYSSLNALGNCSDILVFPSGRTSDRVPFGTGKAVQDLLKKYDDRSNGMMTYNPEAILLFCSFMKVLSEHYSDFVKGSGWEDYCKNPILTSYLISSSFTRELEQVLQNCSNESTYKKRIIKFFNPFRLMKFLHYSESKGIEKVPVLESSKSLINTLQISGWLRSDALESHLEVFRKYDHPEYLP